MNAVWVLAEHDLRGLRECAREVIREGRALADQLRVHLHVILMGDSVEHLLEPTGQQDVDVIYRVESPNLNQYTTEMYVATLVELLTDKLTGPLLISATANGKDLAPRLAARLKAGYVSRCIWVKAGPAGDLRMIQPIYQDRLQAARSCPAGIPVVVGLRPGVIGVDVPVRCRTPEIIPWQPGFSELQPRAQTQLLESIPGDPSQISPSEAEIVLAGGRGIKDKEAWKMIVDLAEVLGASIGGSRVALDLGYIPRERMIGQTGIQIQPRLYLSVGISGVTHHLGGVKADTIVAINSDKNAPIIRRSALAAICDLHQVLPSLIECIRSEKSMEDA